MSKDLVEQRGGLHTVHTHPEWNIEKRGDTEAGTGRPPSHLALLALSPKSSVHTSPPPPTPLPVLPEPSTSFITFDSHNRAAEE